MSSNQLNDISKVYMEAVYGGGKKEKEDTRMVVTNADKKQILQHIRSIRQVVKHIKLQIT